MRFSAAAATLLMTLVMAACSTIETRPGDTAAFAAGNFTYYKWRSQPLSNPTGSTDALYLMDPLIRRELDAGIGSCGAGFVPDRMALLAYDDVVARLCKHPQRHLVGHRSRG